MEKRRKHSKASSSKNNHKPHFFKFLFPDPFTNQLQIPNNFYKNLPRQPPKRAALVIRGGKFWEVEVCQNDEGICFARGWPEFAKAHNMQKGYFVVFRYEGNMVFNVEVFDTTCCLKDYRSAPSEPPTFNFESSKFVDLIKNATLEGSAQVPIASGEKRKNASGNIQLFDKEDKEQRIKKKLKISIQKGNIRKCSSDELVVPQIEKALNHYSTTKFISPFEISKFVDLTTDGNSGGDTQVPTSSGKEMKNASGKVPVIDKEDSEQRKKIVKRKIVKEKIRKSSSKKHAVPHFEKTLNRFSTTKSRPSLVIPKWFCIENGLVTERTVFLKNSKGRKWPVNFCIRNNTATLAKGWRAFSTENGLKEDDRCIFQLVNRNTFLCDQCSRRLMTDV